jgi:hypothetical protein
MELNYGNIIGKMRLKQEVFHMRGDDKGDSLMG